MAKVWITALALLGIGAGAAPLAAQTPMPPQQAAEYRAKWENWNRCGIAATFYATQIDHAPSIERYKLWGDQAIEVAKALAAANNRDPKMGELLAASNRLLVVNEFKGNPALAGPQVMECMQAAVYALLDREWQNGPLDTSASAPAAAPPPLAPSPAPAAVPAASAPISYTLAFSVNGRGGAVTYARGAGPGELVGRWSQIDGALRGEETARRTSGGSDGGLAGTYTTSGIANGARYSGRLTMTARGSALNDKIRFYDLAWDNGERGFGIEEGPRLHIVYSAAVTGILTPSADSGGWELVWIGPDGPSGIAVGKAFWRGSLVGTHQASDPDKGESFAIEVTETTPGTLGIVLPGGFAGIALKAGG